MTKEYNNNDTGALFSDDSSSNRDHNGTAEIVCTHCGAITPYWVSAWNKVSKAGNKFISLAFTKKEERKAEKPKSNNRENSTSDEKFDDDIPF